MTDHDIVTDLRQRHANVTGIDPRITTPIVGPTIFSQAADEIERLRAERDEARKMYCKFVARNEPKYIAERWGWDCFKEDTHD
jgi:hypothetical protein